MVPREDILSSDYMSLNIQTMQLTISFVDKADLSNFMGTNKISIILKDEKNKQSTYDLSLSLLNFKKTDPPPLIAAADIRNSTQTIVSAEIETITSMGDVTIRFSEPMKTDVNLTDLSKVLELYI